MPYFVVPDPLCKFFCPYLKYLPYFVTFFTSICNFQAAPRCIYIAPFCNHKDLPLFVIILPCFVTICRINLGMSLYDFDMLLIFPRKSNRGEDDQHILNFWSLAVEKTQTTSELFMFLYQCNYFIQQHDYPDEDEYIFKFFSRMRIRSNASLLSYTITKNQLFQRQQKGHTISIKKLYLTNLSKMYTN